MVFASQTPRVFTSKNFACKIHNLSYSTTRHSTRTKKVCKVTISTELELYNINTINAKMRRLKLTRRSLASEAQH